MMNFSADQSPSLLIVDDSPTIRKMIRAALKPLNPMVGEAGSGLEAIEQLAIRKYDAITLDLNMPDMHGLDFILFVRSHVSFQKIPIVVVSTRADEPTRNAILASGANRYVTKPFTPEELVAMVSELLNHPSADRGVLNE
jgi:two-component system, chemotaxis family, chemotaxis protein CheY